MGQLFVRLRRAPGAPLIQEVQEEDYEGETTPLLPKQGRVTLDQMNEYEYKNSVNIRLWTAFFYFLCTLTGQFIPSRGLFSAPALKTCAVVLFFTVSVPLLLVNLIVNLGSLVFDVFAISSCRFGEHCGFIYMSQNHTNSTLHMQPPTLDQFDDWQKAVITAATVSGVLSYVIMAWALYGRYSGFCKETALCRTDLLWCCVSWCVSFSKCSVPPHHKDIEDTNIKLCNALVINPFYDKNYDLSMVLNSRIEDPEQKSGKPNDWMSSLLAPKQYFFFFGIFLLNLAIFAVSVIVFFMFLSRKISSYDLLVEGFDIAGLAAQFVSQFAAIMSCFIFSKVAYAVSNRCLDFTTLYSMVANTKPEDRLKKWNSFFGIAPKATGKEPRPADGPGEGPRPADADGPGEGPRPADADGPGEGPRPADGDGPGEGPRPADGDGPGEGPRPADVPDVLTVLKKLDQKYVLLLENTMRPFGSWFTIHWVLYTVTAFMSIAYVADRIITDLYGDKKPEIQCHGEQNLDCQLSLVYIIFFSLQHCILFLYPCFRAASITRARRGMIKALSKETWQYVTPAEKREFIEYLKEQNASFKISVLCARLSFGFEMAYISIIIGVFGVVMKLSL